MEHSCQKLEWKENENNFFHHSSTLSKACLCFEVPIRFVKPLYSFCGVQKLFMAKTSQICCISINK